MTIFFPRCKDACTRSLLKWHRWECSNSLPEREINHETKNRIGVSVRKRREICLFQALPWNELKVVNTMIHGPAYSCWSAFMCLFLPMLATYEVVVVGRKLTDAFWKGGTILHHVLGKLFFKIPYLCACIIRSSKWSTVSLGETGLAG